MTTFSKKYAMLGAAFTMGTFLPSAAFATGLTPVTSDNGVYDNQGGFSTIFERVGTSFAGIPGVITLAAYIMGVVFALGGILKIKDHVEDPGRTQLKDGAIRLVVGGALFALPYVMTVMTQTVGDQTASVQSVKINKASFGFN